MASINICIFMGNLTRDPEVKFTPKGTAVADIGIAINKVWMDDKNQKHESVSFFNLIAWGRTAEIAGEYLHKGDLAHFQCEAQLDQWDDKKSGEKRSAVKFRVEKLTLMPNGKHEAREERQPARSSAPPPAQRQARPPMDPDLEPDEDIPF